MFEPGNRQRTCSPTAEAPHSHTCYSLCMAIKWKQRKYTQEQFTEAWTSSSSIADVIRKLELSAFGSTYQTLRDTARLCGLTKAHMTGQAWSRGRALASEKTKRYTLEDALVENSTYNRVNLKVRLLRLGRLPNLCSVCGQGPSWNGLPLVLQLDHINGTNNDNRIENLRILCPNCHTQTATFCSRKRVTGL